MKDLPKKLSNGRYAFLSNCKKKFVAGKGYVTRIVLYNQVLTPKINSYEISKLNHFYKEYKVSDVEFLSDL